MLSETGCIYFILVIIVILVGCPLKFQVAALVTAVIGLVCYLMSDREMLTDNPDSQANVDAASDTPTDDSKAIVNSGKFRPEWDNSRLVYDLFAKETHETTRDGDSRLADKMREVSLKNKEAIEARARFTSDNFRANFQEELDEQEKRHWWENDNLDALMVKD